MNNIFVFTRRNEGARKVFSWFLAVSMIFNGYVAAFVPLASAHEDSSSSAVVSTTSSGGGVDVSISTSATTGAADNSASVNVSTGTSAGDANNVQVTVDNSAKSGEGKEDEHKHDGDDKGQNDTDDSSNKGQHSDSPHVDTLVNLALSLNTHHNDGDNDSDDHGDHDHHKIQICHIPQGNPENAHTIDVDDHSVTLTAHLGHGDKVGPCPTPTPAPAPTPTPVPQPEKAKIIATKIVCDKESDLPNYGLGGPDITANTATNFIAAHPACHLESGWNFQWGFGDKQGISGVKDIGRNFVGEADGSNGAGTNTGTSYDTWKTFGPTDASGVATVEIADFHGASRIWIREVLKDGYIPFTYDTAHPTNTNNVSAEMYCHADVLNYDNYDYVGNPVLGNTYYCVAWNVQTAPQHVNQKPVITLLGANPLDVVVGTSFTDPGATAFDLEDGTITPAITSTVNSSATGTYTVTYNATDTQGLAADPKIRTVHVVASSTPGCTSNCGGGTSPQCSDGVDNDGDGKIDMDDTGCDNSNDNDENNKPVITLLGDVVVHLFVNTTFTDPGATAFDLEDGTITPVIATSTVNPTVIGTYTVTYNVSDSKGLAADPKTRTVMVDPGEGCMTNCGGGGTGTTTPPTQCSDGIDNDNDGKIDYPADPGCENSQDNDENSKPVITVLGDNPLQLTVGTSFTDSGATAFDLEDGTITDRIVATSTVNPTIIGTYTVTYNATDTKGLAADTKTRTVNVVAAPTTCTTNCGGGGGGSSTFDYWGCTDSTATNYNRLANKDDGSCQHGGGGGGGGPITLSLFNERISVVDSTTVKITWNTNLNADSRVVYGTTSVPTIDVAPKYGYPFTTATDTITTTNHDMTITGLTSGAAYYFRPVSSDGTNKVTGIELSYVPTTGGTGTGGGGGGGSGGNGGGGGTQLPQGCYYLREYLRLGYNNNPDEVRKLQTFLRDEEGFSELAVTGFFDTSTDQAVRTFQDRYRPDVLDPWGLPANTGYVYYTTQKKINEIHCKHIFPLTDAQLAEIRDFFDLLNRLKTEGGALPEFPIVGSNGTQGGSVAGAATGRSSEGAGGSEGGTSSKGRIALRDLLATIPSIGSSSSASGTEGVVAGTTTERTRGLAAVASALAEKMNTSTTNAYVIIFLVFLAIILLAIYGILRGMTPEEDAETEKTTIIEEQKK